jgi:hypothetical protein
MRSETKRIISNPFLFKIIYLKKQNQVPIFFIRLLHSVHFRDILSGYFLYSRFDWSIFVTQLVAKHMKEIINYNVPSASIISEKFSDSRLLLLFRK